MGTTADKLQKILNTKEAIKQAIRDKGVYIGDHDAFAEYPDAIRSIETSSGEGGEEITGSYIIAKFPDDMEEGNDYFKKATELDVSHLDVSRMRNMNNMFNGYEKLTALDLSSWDVSNIEEMENTFSMCNNITIFGDISNWNTSNLRKTRSMFGFCQGLTELNLSNWDVNNLEDMCNMFEYCENLEVLDLRNWDVSNLEQMESSFYDCRKLHTIRLDNCNHDTIEKVVTSSEFPTNYIEEGVTRKIYVNPDNIGDLIPPTNWVFVDSDGNEIEIEEPEIYVPGYYKDKSEITEATTMVNSSHDNLSEMFSGCENLQTINGIDQWDTSNVTNMWSMFYYCKNLTSLDLSNWNTSNVTNMYRMFYYCESLTSLDLSNFDTGNVENMAYMFYYCKNLTSLDISSFNTSNVTYMDMMFHDCQSLTSLDLSSFDTSNVTNMDSMFFYCRKLETLNISNFDVSNVENTNNMFYGCYKLRELRLDNCSTETVEKIITSSNFPTDAIDGVTRKIYVNPDNLGDLTAPENWIFVDSDGNEIGGGELPVCEYCGEPGCDGSCTYCYNCGNLYEECTCTCPDCGNLLRECTCGLEEIPVCEFCGEEGCDGSCQEGGEEE